MTQVNGTPHAYYNGTWNTSDSSNFAARFASVIERYKLPAPPFTITWSKVGSVSIVNGLTADACDFPGRSFWFRQLAGRLNSGLPTRPPPNGFTTRWNSCALLATRQRKPRFERTVGTSLANASRPSYQRSLSF